MSDPTLTRRSFLAAGAACAPGYAVLDLDPDGAFWRPDITYAWEPKP